MERRRIYNISVKYIPSYSIERDVLRRYEFFLDVPYTLMNAEEEEQMLAERTNKIILDKYGEDTIVDRFLVLTINDAWVF